MLEYQGAGNVFRNLIYTGLTRARKLAVLVFVGTRKAFDDGGGEHKDTGLRQTALRELVGGG